MEFVWKVYGICMLYFTHNKAPENGLRGFIELFSGVFRLHTEVRFAFPVAEHADQQADGVGCIRLGATSTVESIHFTFYFTDFTVDRRLKLLSIVNM